MSGAVHPYLSSTYAQGFIPQYEPFFLERSGIWVLLRPIPNTDAIDAIGCYPLVPIMDISGLDEDFESLRMRGAVSLVLVTDPFFQPDETVLKRHFDKVIAYKDHYLNDFSHPKLYESKNHHYKVRRALRDLEVKTISLSNHLDEWCTLYNLVVAKHDIRGIQTFSRAYFEMLATLSPTVVGAFVENELVACQICLEYDGYVYSHLVASNAKGYETRAAYAVYDFSLQHFKNKGSKFYDLGSGAGTTEASGGLTQLKQGFATLNKSCYLCGKILDQKRYSALSAEKQTNFFPAYRG